MVKILKIIGRFFSCLFGMHEWTCDAQEGKKPTKKQIDAIKAGEDGLAGGFFDYAKMYCKYCGKEADVSKRKRAQYPMPEEFNRFKSIRGVSK